MASLRSLVETGFKSYLDTQSVGATVYTGISSSDKTTPAVICSAREAEEDPMASGNYRVTVAIEIKDTASATSSFDTICAAVKAALWKTDIATSLMGDPKTFHVWGVAAESKIEWETVEDCWVERHIMLVYCCEQPLP